MLFRFVLTPFFLLFGLNMAFGQALEFAQGEFIVLLEDTYRPESFQRNLPLPRSAKTTFRSIPNAPLNLVVVTTDFTRVDENEFLKTLSNQPGVVYAQRNKIIQQRLIPNDTFFSRQWQYVNAGANGGLADADIDIERAWDITTGGVTADGDTIVVCIVDDGYDLTHDDMEQNLWVNRGEIDGDSIDNDGNGYIDDMHGWNVRENNDNIGGNGAHGTPVAGIVGATGNNKIGVSGVNWQVKLMIIRYSENLTESNVLESYSYAYEKRKKYNETNGAEGAFVVSINSSWGIDKGNPDDSPIWCAFYDLLGEQGILSCGATANRNSNIDVDGDLPTACSSDYLLSVTNMNRSDIKVNSAGYGRTTIDLGAHGSETYTVAKFNRYAEFGGTSGATPHVAGAIALMYSVPCPELIRIAKTNPALAALTVKELLLNTVDEKTSLNNRCTSRGRLNVGNAVERAENMCSDKGEAYGFMREEGTLGVHSFNWNENKTGLTTDLRIRAFDATEWVEYRNIQSGFPLTNLDYCSPYEYQVRSYCPPDTLPYGFSRFFTTKGCCYASVIDTSYIENGILNISMTNAESNSQNILEYRLFGQENWDTLIVDGSAVIPGLNECDLIEYRLTTHCKELDIKSAVTNSFFESTDCGKCTDLDYCVIENFENLEEWIQSITINGERFESGQDESSAAAFTGGFVPKLERDRNYIMVLEPGFRNSAFAEYFQIYVDIDQNGIFDENTERIFDPGKSITGTITDTLFLPRWTRLGITRMRVIMSFSTASMACGSTSRQFGEVEDYCIEVLERTNTNETAWADKTFEVNPNPVLDGSSIRLTSDIQGEGLLRILNVTGKTVMQQSIRFEDRNSIDLDISGLTRGSYFVQFVQGSSTIHTRFIKS